MNAIDTLGSHDTPRVAATTSDPALLEELARRPELSILCLVAANPATSAAVVERLTGHEAAAVRRAVVCRPGLPAALVERLMDDPARTVRRAIWRHQEVDLDTVIARLRRGAVSGRVTARLGQLVHDPAVTRRLLGDATTLWWAMGGTVDRETFRTVVCTLPEWQRAHVARTCRFTDRDLYRLSRDPSRPVQEAVAGRADLTAAQRARIVRRGRVWAAAAALRAVPEARPRVRRRIAPHRVVRRVIAERETNRMLMWAWSLSPAWDVGRSLARNPRLGARTARLLAARGPWSVSAELANRDDVATMVQHLQLSPQVQLVLACNPATPTRVIRRLLDTDDPYVRGQAIGHPAAPIEEVRLVLADPSTPAWIVRRAAHHPGLDPDERDASLSWIALGGGAGDPNFDPVTCTGNPDVTTTPDAAYDAEARRVGLGSVLWRAREHWVARHHRLGFDTLTVLASDPHWNVRRRIATFEWLWLLDELRWDEHHAVAAAASRTRDGAATKERQSRRTFYVGAAKVFGVLAATATIALIGDALSDDPGGPPRVDVDAVAELPDGMPRTDLVLYDDRCVVMRSMVAIGRDDRGRFAVSFVAGRDTERWITFAASPTAPPMTAAHASSGETVTVVLPLDRLVATVVERPAGRAAAAEPIQIDLARPAIITEDCR